MSNFSDTVKQDTPRLVVMYRQDGDKELLQWGIVGVMPILTLLGAVVRVQAELSFRAAEECDLSALVIAWDAERRAFDWFVHPSIPVDSLVGMLEVIKVTITNTHIARQAAAQQIQLLRPDGQPVRR